jgi:hypothetical protein
MRRLLLLPVPEVVGVVSKEDHSADSVEEEAEEKKVVKKVVEKTIDCALPSDYNVRDEFIAVAGMFKLCAVEVAVTVLT